MAEQKVDYPIMATCAVAPKGKGCDGKEDEAAAGVKGIVEFVQNDEDSCLIRYNIAGLTEGKHGFHIHELADFSQGCVSARGHYNPFGKKHGGPQDKERHVGDMGNIVADKDGNAVGEMIDPLIKLSGLTTIIGRSVMVHAGEDDLGRGGFDDSLTTGHAGGRVACGEVLVVAAKSIYPIKATCAVAPKGKGCDGKEDEAAVMVKGVVEFVQKDEDTCLISYNITGLTEGKHGFHIHELADFSQGCVSAKGHYNPFGKKHGGPKDRERHVGDMGNIVADKDGNAVGQMVDPLIKLTGLTTIIGRSVMVHAGEDDLGQGGYDDSLTTGHAGGRVACGEVVLA